MRILKLKKGKIIKYLKFLNKYKELVGFAGWKVFLYNKVEPNDSIARIWADAAEKELEIYLFESFLELSDDQQKNVLFHELVHARVAYFRVLSNRATGFLEEDLVNDLVRGFEKFGDFKWLKTRRSKST